MSKHLSIFRRLRALFPILVWSVAVATSVGADEPDVPYRLTVITHGFRPPHVQDRVSDWAKHLRDKLKQQSDEVLIFDWSQESNDAAPGWAEAAGDELFARIMWTWLRKQRPIDLHLIGHSRGAVVNSEAQRRLYWHTKRFPSLKDAVHRIHVTLLDPHPANGRVGMSHAKSLDATFLAKVTEQFALGAADPDPVLWPNTTYAESFFQRSSVADLAKDLPLLDNENASSITGPARVSLLMNLFGDGRDAPFAKQLDVAKDLTSTRLVWREDGRDIGPLACSHTTIGFWYAAHVATNKPLQSLEDNQDRDAAERRSALVQSAQCDTIFNGDFRFDGQVKNGGLRILQEENQIPGWKADNPLDVTPEGRLRLAAFSKSATLSSVTGIAHGMLFVPQEAAQLSIETSLLLANGGSQAPASLAVYLQPVVQIRERDLSPDKNRSRWKRLAQWQLTAAADDEPKSSTQVIPLRFGTNSVGKVGVIRLELSAAPNTKAVVELDNFRLETSTNR